MDRGCKGLALDFIEGPQQNGPRMQRACSGIYRGTRKMDRGCKGLAQEFIEEPLAKWTEDAKGLLWNLSRNLQKNGPRMQRACSGIYRGISRKMDRGCKGLAQEFIEESPEKWTEDAKGLLRNLSRNLQKNGPRMHRSCSGIYRGTSRKMDRGCKGLALDFIEESPEKWTEDAKGLLWTLSRNL
ncbi:hypothetical protein M8J76_001997 [Diaphorina citri]|nr:hypothetical protein M8J76_001997 [Diaphorina citri]